MQGPRNPTEVEFPKIVSFLDKSLREGLNWSISSEYPTAITPANLSNMHIITENEALVSHAVCKPLVIKSPTLIYKVAAIGSVVTAEEFRGQGHSTKVLESCLASAQKQNCDIAILWTDKYDFYRRLGFELAGTEISVVFENEFEAPLKNITFLTSTKVAPEAILRLYNQHTVGSVRMGEDLRKFLNIPNTVLHTAWGDNNTLLAYAVEGKGADLQGYVHEWGGSVEAILSLLSHVRKTKGKPFTMIIPRHSINLLGRLRKMPVVTSEGFLGMIKLVDHEKFFAKVKKAAASVGLGNLILEKSGDGFTIGVGEAAAYIPSEQDMVRVLFGPFEVQDCTYVPEQLAKTLSNVFPMNLWIWGWDSI